MVRDAKVSAYLLTEEVPISNYHKDFNKFLTNTEKANLTNEHLLLLQQIIKSRTFYDIRNRAESTPEKFKLQSKYQYTLQAYVEGWKSKLLQFNAFCASSLRESATNNFSLELNLYTQKARVTKFHGTHISIDYVGDFELFQGCLRITLLSEGQENKVPLTLSLLIGPQKIEDLNLIKGIFVSFEPYQKKMKSGDFYLFKYVKKKHIKNTNTMNHLNISRSLAINQNQFVLCPSKLREPQSFFDNPDFSNDILSPYIGTYLVYRIHDNHLETCVFRLYDDYRATFQHPDFFGGTPMNCRISILNKASILQLSVLHQKTDEEVMLIITKISDVKDLLVSQRQVLIDLTTPIFSKNPITFNRNSTDPTLIKPYLNVSKLQLNQVKDFNDLKEVDKLRRE